MRKLLLGCISALAAFAMPALAVDGNILFNGTVSSSCAFSSASAGTLTVSGTSLVSATPGTISITNNDPAVYTASLGTTTLSTSPNGEALTSVTATPTVTGVNAGITLPASLANDGVDTVSVALTSGVVDSVATAGTYIVTQVVSCDVT